MLTLACTFLGAAFGAALTGLALRAQYHAVREHEARQTAAHHARAIAEVSAVRYAQGWADGMGIRYEDQGHALLLVELDNIRRLREGGK